MTDDDPIQFLEVTRALFEQGEYSAALAKHLWFYRNAPALWPFMYGVRLSFALDDWIRLAHKYPPALAALEEVRDSAIEEIKDGSTNRAIFHDVVAIGRALGESARSYALLKQLAAANPNFARSCIELVLPEIVKAEDYLLARQFIDSPEAHVKSFADKLNRVLQGPEGDFSRPGAGRAHAVHVYAKRVRLILVTVKGVGEISEACRLRDLAVSFVPSASSAEVAALLEDM